MEKKKISAIVEDTQTGLQQKITRNYNSEITIDDYKVFFLNKVKSENEAVKPVVVSILLTVHDQDGNIELDENKNQVWETIYSLC